MIEEICPGAKLGKIEVTFGTGEGEAVSIYMKVNVSSVVNREANLNNQSRPSGNLQIIMSCRLPKKLFLAQTFSHVRGNPGVAILQQV